VPGRPIWRMPALKRPVYLVHAHRHLILLRP
jgi:hypothetical protein